MEEAIFSSGSIIVTKTLAKFPSTTFPINGIGSVSVIKPKVAGKVIGGIIALAIALPAFSSSNSFGLGVIALGVSAIFFWKAYRAPYILVIRTASGDSRAMETPDYEYLAQVKRAIETAATLRG